MLLLRRTGSTLCNFSSPRTIRQAVEAADAVGTRVVPTNTVYVAVKPNSGVTLYYSVEGATPDATYPQNAASPGEVIPCDPLFDATVYFGGLATVDFYTGPR